MRREFITSSRFLGIRGVAFDEEPIQFVLPYQPSICARHRKRIAKSFGGTLIRITEGSPAVLCASAVLAAKIKHITVCEMEIIQVAEEFRLSIARNNRNIKARGIVFTAHEVHRKEQDRGSAG